MTLYTAANVREAMDPQRERLFAPYAVGRPATWTTDQRTKDLWCLGRWLDEEMTRTGVDDLGRRVQLATFNRYSRSDEDLFELAAQIMNDTLSNNFDRNRKTHRRWG